MTWDEIEERLYQATAAALRHFSKDHPSESFYGFAFACNADYGEVMLCLNTAAGLRATVAQRYASWSAEEVETRLKWNPGDWEYANFNTKPPYEDAWDAAWSDTQEAIAEATFDDDGEDIPEIFLGVACRVMIALERNDEFRLLQRDPAFATFVTDHDESQGDAWERLRMARHDTGAT